MEHKSKALTPALTPLFCLILLILGASQPAAQADDDTLNGAPAAVKTGFEAVAAKLDPNGHLYAYLSTEQALSKVNETLEGLVNMARDCVGTGLMDNPFIAPIVEGVLGVIEPAFRQSGITEIN